MPGAHRDRTRRLVDAILGVALALAVLAPMVFGPAFMPLTRALGGDETHVCACGMAPGKCGCPECERVEHERLRESAPRPYPVLRGPCSRDTATSGYASLPPSIAPSTGVLLPRAPVEWVTTEALENVPSRLSAEPATPPPRRAA
jgi:hypothetical protein